MAVQVRTPLLTLDRGNSTLDAMLHADSSRRERLAPGASLPAFLGSERPRGAVCASVVPGGLDAVAEELGALGIPVAFAGTTLRCPLAIDYDTPHTLGVDRWLGALCAHRRYGASVVVDCGTALTVNLVETDGTFRGGAIAPGLRSMARGLAENAPALPLADPERATAVPPRSSAAAVSTGVLLAFCGAVERLVADTLAAARGPCTVVLTGGHAADYLRRGRLRPVVVPDLVHQGLRILAEEAAWNC